MSSIPEEWIDVEWGGITSKDGFRRGPFGGNLKKSFFVKSGYSVYEQYAPINDDCTSFRYFINEEKYQELSSFWVNRGDFLISCSGTMGRITRVPESAPEGVINQALLRIRLIEGVIHPDFFLKLFRSPYIQSLVLGKSGGGAIQNLAAVKELKKIRLPLPPLPEQKEIASRLDTLLGQVENIKKRIDGIPEILKKFRQSVLAAAVSGKLTEEWRRENECEDWLNTSWGQILREGKNSFKRGPFGSSLKKSMFVSEGYKVYEQYCPINDDCSYERYYVTEEKFQEMKGFEALDGDFLISCSGVSLGRITQVPKGSKQGIINQALLRVRLNSEIYDDKFFVTLFRSPRFQKDLFKNSTGSAIPNLKGVKDLKAMIVPLPSIEEQKEIVRKVENVFTFAEAIDVCVKEAQSRVDNLTQSILAKAFSGDLTANWREENSDLISGENSAEALLERIRVERKKLVGGKKKPLKKKVKN